MLKLEFIKDYKMKKEHLVFILEAIAIIIIVCIIYLKKTEPIPYGTNLLTPSVANQVIKGDFK